MNEDLPADLLGNSNPSFNLKQNKINDIEMRQETNERSVIEFIENFRVAVENGEIEQVENLLEKINNMYENASANEMGAVERSLLTRSHTELVYNEQVMLSEHSQQATATRLVRAVFLAMGSTFIADPETADAQDMLAVTERLKQSERSFKKKRKKAASIVADVSSSLPPAVAILSIQKSNSPIEVGKSYGLTVVIGNSGDAPAKGVQLQVRGEAGLQIDSPPASVGEVDAGASVTRKFTLTNKRSGTHTLTFLVSSSNAGSATDQATVVVIEEGEFASVPDRSDGDDLAGLDSENLPDWFPVAGGAGAFGLGAGAYGYLRRNGDSGNEDEESEWL